MASSVAADGGDDTHPLLARREPSKALLVVLTSDRGLCGGFNSSIIKQAERFLTENADRFETIEVATLGRRGADHFRKRDVTVHDHPGIFDGMNFRAAADLADDLSEVFEW